MIRDFRKGERVALSALGEENGWRPRAARTGVVTGFFREGDMVYVRWDGGRKTSEPYPVEGIESIEPSPPISEPT